MWEDLTFVVTVLGFTAAITLLLVELHTIAGRTAHRWIREQTSIGRTPH
jgi:hypothetical protein